MKISLCLITKNEQEKIRKCIESAKHLVDETIVVDTGSTDNTINIAKEMGAKVHHFEWINDFAQARNYAIEKCIGEWIIFLDADEYLGKITKKEFLKTLKSAEKHQVDALIGELTNIEESTGSFQSIIKSIRVFKRLENIEYKGAIHEALYHKVRPLRMWDGSEIIKIFHTGYSVEEVKNKDKGKRNLELLLSELEKNPKSSDICFYLVECYLLNGDIEQALEYTYKVEEYSNGIIAGVYQKNILHRLKAMIALDKTEIQVLDEYKKGLQIDETYPDYEYAMLEYYIAKNSINKAIEYSNRTIEKMNKYSSPVESWIISNAQGVFLILSNLYLLNGNKTEGIKILVSILKEDKYNYDSLYKLVMILEESEGSIDIFNLLTRLYDVNKVKDKLYLIRVTKNMKKQFVNNMIYNLLSEEEKKCMDNI